MKKTIACLAMIAGAATALNAHADAKKAEKNKAETRNPAGETGPGTFVGCKPAYNIYRGSEEYKNNCAIPVQTFQVPAMGFVPPGSTDEVVGCDKQHQLIVSSKPISFRCLPPGAVEL